MQSITYIPIGVIKSPFRDIQGTPIQPCGARGVQGEIEIKEEFLAGLRDLEGFSHIILIYHFHLSRGFSLEVKPFLDDRMHGVFATRAPKRPNPIGISVVQLVKIDGKKLHIKDVDILDGTPLLDIKPFVPEFDNRETARIGWLDGTSRKAKAVKADDRFR
jgi:tRNA-Thr(GGU) m(6)t(6)A37 methyltransferase TsaA